MYKYDALTSSFSFTGQSTATPTVRFSSLTWSAQLYAIEFGGVAGSKQFVAVPPPPAAGIDVGHDPAPMLRWFERSLICSQSTKPVTRTLPGAPYDAVSVYCCRLLL